MNRERRTHHPSISLSSKATPILLDETELEWWRVMRRKQMLASLEVAAQHFGHFHFSSHDYDQLRSDHEHLPSSVMVRKWLLRRWKDCLHSAAQEYTLSSQERLSFKELVAQAQYSDPLVTLTHVPSLAQ